MKKKLLALTILLTISGKIFTAWGVTVANHTDTPVKASIEKGMQDILVKPKEEKWLSSHSGDDRKISWITKNNIKYITDAYKHPQKIYIQNGGKYRITEKEWWSKAKDMGVHQAYSPNKPIAPTAPIVKPTPIKIEPIEKYLFTKKDFRGNVSKDLIEDKNEEALKFINNITDQLNAYITAYAKASKTSPALKKISQKLEAIKSELRKNAAIYYVFVKSIAKQNLEKAALIRQKITNLIKTIKTKYKTVPLFEKNMNQFINILEEMMPTKTVGKMPTKAEGLNKINNKIKEKKLLENTKKKFLKYLKLIKIRNDLQNDIKELDAELYKKNEENLIKLRKEINAVIPGLLSKWQKT